MDTEHHLDPGRGLRAPADALTYRRAATTACVGLGIQVVLLVATGLAALWADAGALYAVAWHIAAGLPIWGVLWLIFQQHEAERRQRLAADQLATRGDSTAAIFGNLSDDLDAARTRLDRLYRWGLPLVSTFVAAWLVMAGATLAWFHARPREADVPGLAVGCDPVGLMFVLAGIAFTAFVAARWISGFSRQRAWQLLRGGASYLMSCFVVTAVLFVGAVTAAVLDDARLFGWLAAVIPAVMILVGFEILATSLLEAYRPRVPGQIPRPAFDSRILGLLTAPESLGRVVAETISYQFGVEVSRSWLYRLLGSAVTPLAIFALTVLGALSCLTIVGPDERGVVLRFGAMRDAPLQPGIHLKWPWPVETVEMHPVGAVQQILVSSDLTGRTAQAAALLWTTDGDSEAALGQEPFLAAPAPGADGDGAGVALVAADVMVQYRVEDLPAFVVGSVEPDRSLRLAAEREVSVFFATHDIDDLLGCGRIAAGAALRDAIQTRADRMRSGVEVVAVAITALHPPIGEVSRAFHAQIGAVQQRETSIQEARRDAVVKLAKAAGSVELGQRIDTAIRRLDDLRRAGDSQSLVNAEADIDRLLGEARGEAAELVHEARAYRWTKVVRELASRERFAGELLAYQRSPNYYRTRRFLDVLAAGLAGRRKFVIAGDAGETPVFRMDFSDPASAIDTLLTE